jgi:regulation of enolase protein 1 (concanavalin A-like superfamily)
VSLRWFNAPWIKAGAMCAAPDGPGFTARFQDLRVRR